MNLSPFSRGPGVISQALHTLVSQIPASLEAPSANPAERVKSLGKTAALKAAAISGSFTLPPGPFGMVTVLPDLLAVWRVQQQLVADIAGAYGKTSALTPETMVICLFKHGGIALTKPLLSQRDDSVVVQRIANRTLLQLLEKVAVRLTQRIAAKSMFRWLPALGALGAGAYAYYDTAHVAANAIDLFSRELKMVEAIDASESTPTPTRTRRRTHSSRTSSAVAAASTKRRRKSAPRTTTTRRSRQRTRAKA